MVSDFERAQAEYEWKMTHPYEDEDEDEEEYENAYWSYVDAQMEDAKLGY